MTTEEFNKLFQEMIEDEKSILDRKGKEYRCGEEDDVHANFKRLAKLLNITPEQVWAVYFMKHVDAIINYIREGKKTHSEESISSRVYDARNYLALGLGLLSKPWWEGTLDISDNMNIGGYDIASSLRANIEQIRNQSVKDLFSQDVKDNQIKKGWMSNG